MSGHEQKFNKDRQRWECVKGCEECRVITARSQNAHEQEDFKFKLEKFGSTCSICFAYVSDLESHLEWHYSIQPLG